MVPPRGNPSRRPPPLLVLAAAGLVAVIGIGAVLILTRGGSSPQSESAEPVPVAPAPEVSAPRIPAPARTPTPTPTPTPAKSVQEVIAETGEIPEGTRPEDLPIWARPPRVLSQPFPEGGRINPPLPPVNLPPEMLAPAQPPGAAP